MQDKKELAKLILAGILLTASLPTDVQAENFSSNEVYLAVAGCGGGCGGKDSKPAAGDKVADATGQYSTPSTEDARLRSTTSSDKTQPLGGGTNQSQQVDTTSKENHLEKLEQKYGDR